MTEPQEICLAPKRVRGPAVLTSSVCQQEACLWPGTVFDPSSIPSPEPRAVRAQTSGFVAGNPAFSHRRKVPRDLWPNAGHHRIAGEQDAAAALQALGGADLAISTAVNPSAFEAALGGLARGAMPASSQARVSVRPARTAATSRASVLGCELREARHGLQVSRLGTDHPLPDAWKARVVAGQARR
jgi:hypothetical protein